MLRSKKNKRIQSADLNTLSPHHRFVTVAFASPGHCNQTARLPSSEKGAEACLRLESETFSASV